MSRLQHVGLRRHLQESHGDLVHSSRGIYIRESMAAFRLVARFRKRPKVSNIDVIYERDGILAV